MKAPRVEIVLLASWNGGGLVAEYDAGTDTIRVDAGAVARVRAVRGDADAARFVACAVAHERYHRAFPYAREAAAHAHARAVTGVDPRAFERALRG